MRGVWGLRRQARLLLLLRWQLLALSHGSLCLLMLLCVLLLCRQQRRQLLLPLLLPLLLLLRGVWLQYGSAGPQPQPARVLPRKEAAVAGLLAQLPCRRRCCSCPCCSCWQWGANVIA
jgi:hypothetical protein